MRNSDDLQFRQEYDFKIYLCRKADPESKGKIENGVLQCPWHGAKFDLCTGANVEWVQNFPGGIFGYEHRTFSQSPVENALELVEFLPKNVKLSVLTHSRGGLVGDLLCLGRNINDSIIDNYKINTKDSDDIEGLEIEEKEERQRLRELLKLLKDKNILVQRYVRVACPARGTRLLSENLDVALSDFTNLLQIAGGALVGTAAGAIGGPAAAKVFGKGASSALGVLKRLVLEIAGRRIDPKLIPGIAAMRVDSPLASFLAHPEIRRHDTTEIAVIAGDTEFSSLGLSDFRRRIANLFCDWRLFDKQDNDLVVDTDSMYAGLGFKEGVHYLLDQASSVTHFRYFSNPTTRLALREWLVLDNTSEISQFQSLTTDSKTSWDERDRRMQQRGGVLGPRPVVILIPGIMGSHIEINRNKNNDPGTGNRIWFDIPSLAIGKLNSISNPSSNNIFTEDIFEKFYGDIAEELDKTHVVIRCPYDWRKSLVECAEELQKTIGRAIKENPDQPIRLLAHSMGGLVVRTLIEKHTKEWQEIIKSGGRLVMLGTPNNGSHMMVHTLLGKNDSMRMLANLDLVHDLQQILNIVKKLPGALSLLPRFNFDDTGHENCIDTTEYYATDTWETLKNKNKDFWYGDQIAGVPEQETLKNIKEMWETGALKDNSITNPERVSYVFGQGDKTACGVIKKKNSKKNQLLFTPDGDGTVTWKSGKLENLHKENCWYLPVEHGDLLNVSEYFPAIVDLLEKGTTKKLGRLPKQRDVTSETFILEASPPVVPNEEELMRAIMGSGLRKHTPINTKKKLKVSVLAGDLRHCTSPVLCGHYYGDIISGAEGVLNHMLKGQLYKRRRLDVYADAVGTSTIVLQSPNSEDILRKTRKGAIIVGLGEMNGRLSSSQVTETVRAAILRLLLRAEEISCDSSTDNLKISSLLIGHNSTASISIGESLAAVVRGVCEANLKFDSDKVLISEIEFIELYNDVAITAAHEIRSLPSRMKGDLERLCMQLDTVHELQLGQGSRDRLWAANSDNYWPRLIVTDADKNEELCPPECYKSNSVNSIDKHVLHELLGKGEYQKAMEILDDRMQSKSEKRYPDNLRYVFVSERARSESTAIQRQPGLIESVVKKQLNQKNYNGSLSRTLFELMIPLEYKSTAREVSNLVLQLDGYTANLPWELLQADNNEPMVLKTAMVRQLTTQRYRRNVRTATAKTACIIVDPSTEDYAEYFGKTPDKKLPQLEGAVNEGRIILEKLKDSASGYLAENITYSPSGAESLDVLHDLLSKPYRILAIAAHGIFEEKHRDGKLRTGVVLSEGSLITAAEIGQMEVVPELVFLNCCHLGTLSSDKDSTKTEYNRLAYSVSRELIEMGVRCIVAAGWAVDDKAACTFADTFFDRMLIQKETFGNAVHQARKETYDKHRDTNTWGAYQAYGDPSYRLDPDENNSQHSSSEMSAVAELLQELNNILMNVTDFKEAKKDVKSLNIIISALRERTPSSWFEFPEVLEILGKIYADVAEDGFDIAREYYIQAISGEDKKGIVAIKTIEQLANLEARVGEKRNDQALVEIAIERIEALRTVSFSTERNIPLNPERAALLGSAYKRLASVMVSSGRRRSFGPITDILKKCAESYKESTPSNPAEMPYNTLNYLQFGYLADSLESKESEKNISLAHYCAETARRNYEKTGSFWDAVMPADAEITAWLLGAPVGKDAFEYLKQFYNDSLKDVPAVNRYMDSVATNLCLLSKFIGLRKQSGDITRSKVLKRLADELDPNSRCENSGSAPSKSDSKTKTQK